MTRDFKNTGVHFGWIDVENIFKRDEEAYKNGDGRRTDIARHTTYLDKYTMINSGQARQQFLEKTIG